MANLSESEYNQLMEEQTIKLKVAFKKIDKDGNDKLDEQELMSFLESQGKNIDKDSFKKLVQTLDMDSDGFITM